MHFWASIDPKDRYLKAKENIILSEVDFFFAFGIINNTLRFSKTCIC
jgi:hypothetical protein